MRAAFTLIELLMVVVILAILAAVTVPLFLDATGDSKMGAGVTNLWWIAGLAVFVLAERVLPGGQAVSRIGGALLLLAGAVILVRG